MVQSACGQTLSADINELEGYRQRAGRGDLTEVASLWDGDMFMSHMIVVGGVTLKEMSFYVFLRCTHCTEHVYKCI